MVGSSQIVSERNVMDGVSVGETIIRLSVWKAGAICHSRARAISIHKVLVHFLLGFEAILATVLFSLWWSPIASVVLELGRADLFRACTLLVLSQCWCRIFFFIFLGKCFMKGKHCGKGKEQT